MGRSKETLTVILLRERRIITAGVTQCRSLKSASPTADAFTGLKPGMLLLSWTLSACEHLPNSMPEKKGGKYTVPAFIRLSQATCKKRVEIKKN
jgi:hypothetical protein